jgi:DMSO/TMAO reductase YedYZ molybdopterin-dependent catalytic subunit
VIDLGTHPHVATADCSLTVTAAIQRPLHWDWGTLLRQPQEQRTNNIHCVTFWSRFDNLWSGRTNSPSDGGGAPKPEARYVIIRSYDGYATNLPSASSTITRCC